MKILKYTNIQNDVSGIKRLKFIVNFINKKYKKAKIIDVGCGTGSITIPLGYYKHDIIGIDVDEASIKLAKERNHFKNVKFLKKNIDEVKEKCDVALSIQVLEHLDEPGVMLKKISNITNKYAIITVPNGYGPSEIVGRLITKIRGSIRLKSKSKTNEGMFTANYNNPHVQKFTTNQMKNIAKKSGFKIIKIQNHNFILGTFPFNQLFFHTPFKRFLEDMDSLVANILPHFMASGWYFVMEKKE